MATNHGFADGNKRTTLILLHTLIQNSGYDLVAIGQENKEETVENIILAVVNRDVFLEDLTNWFKARLVQRK
jgi:prophage maintenance system killer protein